MNDDELTTKEMDRLADWLKAQGHSAEEILQCLKYITGTHAPQQIPQNPSNEQ